MLPKFQTNFGFEKVEQLNARAKCPDCRMSQIAAHGSRGLGQQWWTAHTSTVSSPRELCPALVACAQVKDEHVSGWCAD